MGEDTRAVALYTRRAGGRDSKPLVYVVGETGRPTRDASLETLWPWVSTTVDSTGRGFRMQRLGYMRRPGPRLYRPVHGHCLSDASRSSSPLDAVAAAVGAYPRLSGWRCELLRIVVAGRRI